MTLTTPPGDVAIIGAGIAGLTLALALHQRNIPSAIYEARPESHNQGGGIMLSPNSLRALDKIGVYERLCDRALQFDKLYFKNDKNETTDVYYFGSKPIYGYEAIRIMRNELLGVLLAAVREYGIPVYFNSALATVNSDGGPNHRRVEFTLVNGQTATASLLVGADGIHSTVRSTFLPDVKPLYAGILGINCVVNRAHLRIPKDYGLPAICVGKPGGFLLVPQKPDGSELYVGAQRAFSELDDTGWSDLRKDQERLYRMIHEKKEDWPDVVQSALEAMPVDNMGLWAFHGLPSLSTWLSESNQIILVGDAAHAIPPTVGQGANQAVEDVCALASILSMLSQSVPLDEAANLWQSYRKERIERILELTQMNAKRLPESEKARLPPNTVWTGSSSAVGEGGELRWLYDADPFKEAEGWAQELRIKNAPQEPGSPGLG